MRKLFVRHRTRFRYDGEARESVNEVRLGPVDGPRQRVWWTTLRTDPEAEVASFVDAFGNRVWWFQVPDSHPELTVSAESLVEVGDNPAMPPRPIADGAVLETSDYRQDWAEFLMPSSLVAWSDETRRFAGSLAPTDIDDVRVWSEAMALALNSVLTYQRGETDTTTRVDDVIDHGYGVCQDFAHVFVAICRLHGVAAQYVSGWLYEPDRAGPVESHAWAAVQVPNVGWIEIDPTHPGEVGDRYVRVAVGRDYADVVPVKGTYVGDVTTELDVAVELREADNTGLGTAPEVTRTT